MRTRLAPGVILLAGLALAAFPATAADGPDAEERLTRLEAQLTDLEFQLDPVAIQTTAQQAFTPQAQTGPGSASAGFASLNADFVVVGPGAQPPPAAAFNIAQANSFAAAGNVGTALLPQRPTRHRL